MTIFRKKKPYFLDQTSFKMFENFMMEVLKKGYNLEFPLNKLTFEDLPDYELLTTFNEGGVITLYAFFSEYIEIEGLGEGNVYCINGTDNVLISFFSCDTGRKTALQILESFHTLKN